MKLPNKIITAVCCMAVVLQSAALAPISYAQAGLDGAEHALSQKAGAADRSETAEPGESMGDGIKSDENQPGDEGEANEWTAPASTALPEQPEEAEATAVPVTDLMEHASLPEVLDAAEAIRTDREAECLAAFSNPNVILAEDYDGYDPGAKVVGTPGLNTANDATGFSSGYTPWVLKVDQAAPSTDGFVIAPGTIDGRKMLRVPPPTGKVGDTILEPSHATGIHRMMTTSVELGSDSDYYISFSFKVPDKALFNKNRSLKLELLTDKLDSILTFGVITADDSSRDFLPFVKAGGVTYGSGFTAHRSDEVQVLARIRSTMAGKSELYIKCYKLGEPEPADWNVSQLSYTNKSILTTVGVGTNVISGTDPGADFGPMTIERYNGSQLSAIAAAESAVNILRATASEAYLQEAEQLVAALPEGLAKENVTIGLESARTVMIEQKAIMQAADSILSQYENTVLTEENYQDAEEAVAGLKPEIDKLLNQDAMKAYLERVSALENKIAIVRIKVNRAEEDFSYPAGTKLSSTDAAGTFTTGWKADAELESALADAYAVGPDGILTLKGNSAMYRGLKYPVKLDQDVSSFIKLKFSFSGTEKFAGIALGDLRFGVIADNGRYVPAIISGDETVKGNISLQENQTYQAIIRLTGGAAEGNGTESKNSNLTLAVYPEGETVADWQVSAVSANMTEFGTLGIVADGDVILKGLSKDEAGHFYLNQFDDLVSAVKQRNTLPGIQAAETALAQMPDCIANEIFSAQIGNAREINEKTPPVVDYVTVSGTPKTGKILTGAYGLIDKMENADAPVLEWKSGGKVIAKGETWKVESAYEGRTVAFCVTSKNQAGIAGNTKEYELKIDSDTGSAGSGGGLRPGGTGNGSGFTAGGSVTVPNTQNDQTITDFGEVSEPNVFVDLIGHWAQSEVEELANMGIVNGVSKDFFDPDTTVTRAEFAAMLSRVLKNKDEPGACTFPDVTCDDWFEPDVKNMASLGIMVGSADGRFYPGRQITREEMAKSVALAYEIYGGNTERGAAVEFSDADEISEWALPYVQDCSALRLMNGLPNGSFAPAESATRAEAAVVIKHILNSK